MTSNDTGAFFLGNNAAIDFVNTQIIRRGEKVDLLQEGADLARWARQAGRLLDGEPSEENLTEAKNLRRALNDLFSAIRKEASVAQNALKVVNRHLAEHASHEMLRVNDDNDLELIADNTAASVTAMLAELAHEGAELLASPQVLHVKQCHNPDCILLFLDNSRSKKRRWCSMETCGNRAKAARHYRGRSL